VLDRGEVDHPVRDDYVEGAVLESESIDRCFDELDLGEPVTVSQSRGLVDLFVGEVDADHLAGLADLACGAEDVRPGA
jgi:hypothetical protein